MKVHIVSRYTEIHTLCIGFMRAMSLFGKDGNLHLKTS